MPDHLGKDQRRTKDDKEEEKPIQGKNLRERCKKLLQKLNTFFVTLLSHLVLKTSIPVLEVAKPIFWLPQS